MAEQEKGLQKAKNICRDRSRRAKELKGAGRKIMGYVCIYPPVELMSAFDLVPYRIFGDCRGDIVEGDRVLMPVVCPFLRSILDLGMKGRFAFADGLIGAHICDVGSVMIHLWRDYVTAPAFVHFLDVPHTDHLPAQVFFKQQLEFLARDLETFTGRPLSLDSLTKAVELHNRQRALVRELYALRKSDPPGLSAVENIEILMAISSIPVEEGNALLSEVIAEVRKRLPPGKKGIPRILVWGSVIDDISFFEVVENAGAHTVVDDICVGTRAYWTDVGVQGDPFAALARHYLVDIRCPRTYRQAPGADLRKSYQEDLEARFGYLQPFLQDWQVDGVILQSVLYCDTHGFEMPAVCDYLDGLGVPNIVIEHDYSEGAIQQLQTRIEAFVEMIHGGSARLRD